MSSCSHLSPRPYFHGDNPLPPPLLSWRPYFHGVDRPPLSSSFPRHFSDTSRKTDVFFRVLWQSQNLNNCFIDRSVSFISKGSDAYNKDTPPASPAPKWAPTPPPPGSGGGGSHEKMGHWWLKERGEVRRTESLDLPFPNSPFLSILFFPFRRLNLCLCLPSVILPYCDTNREHAHNDISHKITAILFNISFYSNRV